MTPSLARMLGERSRSLSKPIRWFSMPQLFRYERAQRGRLREHFQWNVDIVGEGNVAADAEVLAVAIDGLRELGTHGRRLRGESLRPSTPDRSLGGRSGSEEAKLGAAFAVIDKIERLPEEKGGSSAG